MSAKKRVVVVYTPGIATRVLPTHELAARKRRKHAAIPTPRQAAPRTAAQAGH